MTKKQKQSSRKRMEQRSQRPRGVSQNGYRVEAQKKSSGLANFISTLFKGSAARGS